MNQLFTKEVRFALHAAEAEAIKMHTDMVEPTHLLLGLLVGEYSIARSILKRNGITYEEVVTATKRQSPQFIFKPSEIVGLSHSGRKALDNAKSFRDLKGYIDITTGAILVALVQLHVEPIKSLFDLHGLTTELVIKEVLNESPGLERITDS